MPSDAAKTKETIAIRPPNRRRPRPRPSTLDLDPDPDPDPDPDLPDPDPDLRPRPRSRPRPRPPSSNPPPRPDLQPHHRPRRNRPPPRSNNAAATGNAVSFRAISPFTARFTACYRAALASARSASETATTLHLESDDQGYVTSAHVTGGRPATCRAALHRGARPRAASGIEVDTGTANADVPLTFKPL